MAQPTAPKSVRITSQTPLPKSLVNDLAKSYWVQLVEALEPTEVELTHADIAYLVQYCNAVAIVERLAFAAVDAPIMVRAAGRIPRDEVNPLFEAHRKHFNTMRQCAEHIGLNPLARRKFKDKTDDEKEQSDGFDEL